MDYDDPIIPSSKTKKRRYDRSKSNKKSNHIAIFESEYIKRSELDPNELESPELPMLRLAKQHAKRKNDRFYFESNEKYMR